MELDENPIFRNERSRKFAICKKIDFDCILKGFDLPSLRNYGFSISAMQSEFLMRTTKRKLNNLLGRRKVINRSTKKNNLHSSYEKNFKKFFSIRPLKAEVDLRFMSMIFVGKSVMHASAIFLSKQEMQ